MNTNESEYQFRFASWCASTATRTSRNCRFTAEVGQSIIRETPSLFGLRLGWENLPNPKYFDDWHCKEREKVISKSKEILGPDSKAKFTHGVAAKLINVYMKSLFLASIQENISDQNIAKRNAIHPPIDRVLGIELLKMGRNPSTLSNSNNEQATRIRDKRSTWSMLYGYRSIGWSNFDSEQYQKVIEAIRYVTKHEGLWTIEEYWTGYQ